MLEIDGEPQGQVRYDKISSDEAEIDVSIAPEHRGQGMGTLALCLTRDLAINDLGVSRVVGIVMTSNLASSAAFRKAGFIEGDRRTVKGHECRIFVWPTS
jgi:RimJ/RimL family protein N-acetyltransferase